MRLTKQCHECKQQFRKTELVEYAAPGTKTLNSYCPQCLKEKHAREAFSNKVCTIFGLKKPGPQIWTERKRLQTTYGYTDELIINCLDYIYYVEKKKKLAESLVLVTPYMIDKMMRYKKSQAAQINNLARAAKTELQEHIVPVHENVQKEKLIWNPDDWLDD